MTTEMWIVVLVVVLVVIVAVVMSVLHYHRLSTASSSSSSSSKKPQQQMAALLDMQGNYVYSGSGTGTETVLANFCCTNYQQVGSSNPLQCYNALMWANDMGNPASSDNTVYMNAAQGAVSSWNSSCQGQGGLCWQANEIPGGVCQTFQCTPSSNDGIFDESGYGPTSCMNPKQWVSFDDTAGFGCCGNASDSPCFRRAEMYGIHGNSCWLASTINPATGAQQCTGGQFPYLDTNGNCQYCDNCVNAWGGSAANEGMYLAAQILSAFP